MLPSLPTPRRRRFARLSDFRKKCMSHLGVTLTVGTASKCNTCEMRCTETDSDCRSSYQ